MRSLPKARKTALRAVTAMPLIKRHTVRTRSLAWLRQSICGCRRLHFMLWVRWAQRGIEMHISKILGIVALLLTCMCALSGSTRQPGQVASVGQQGLQTMAQYGSVRGSVLAMIWLNKLRPSRLHSTIPIDTSCSKTCGSAGAQSSCSTSCPSGGVCTAYCRGTTAHCECRFTQAMD
jgi:hypothetical protein